MNNSCSILNMEESAYSPRNSACSKDGSTCSEESSWTMYFADLMASEARRAACGLSSSVVSTGNSVISDAASCVAWKPPPARPEVSEKYKELSLKRRKGKGLLDDDPLEDTASSPVNSPKITEFTNLRMNSSKKYANRDTSQEDVISHRNDPKPKEIVHGFDCTERSNECTELEKRGLCLVPLSLLIDHL